MQGVSSSDMLGSAGMSLIVLASVSGCLPVILCDGRPPPLPLAAKNPGTSAEVGSLAEASDEKD
eukprot:3869665-Karenia_brevis.AAC.1